jgi:hypothetical protein
MRSGFKGWGGNGSGKSKYGAIKTEYNGISYHSKKEADYASQLDFRIKLGEVLKWDRQVSMNIIVNKEIICKYICDFVVTGANGVVEFIDVKGMRSGAAYEMFKLKKKLVKATLGIEIIEK